ncbi:alpha/beta hydrolase [Acinetobacter soli]|uniref:alpha/beta hydrolase n=1 Tax=Acinetobacter soli TaxID=487316 RepID=UPI001ABC1A98|nr:alpha/beta hydrolase [Acinetobacter soli]MBO3639706.1 alpha/beta hydrolase [Acinetobacter soli]WEH89286.1 alpha/beta hydrolase [Acinetobacter soli]WEI08813.1 alpha/beta hydrolase [Acinetobacter soli]
MNRPYDNATTVPSEAAILADFQNRSKRVYRHYVHMADIRYANSPRAIMDIFPVKQAQKTVIFVHGGYWQWCEKSDFAFIVPALYEQNIQCVLLEYALAPLVPVYLMIEQVHEALDFIQHQDWITEHVVVVGHSAGAHLTAMNLTHPLVQKAVLLSGLYDLRPLCDTHLNQALQLSLDDAERLSPALHTLSHNTPCELYCGADELQELKWQSEQFYHALKGLNQTHVELHLLKDINHYSILDAYFTHIAT